MKIKELYNVEERYPGFIYAIRNLGLFVDADEWQKDYDLVQIIDNYVYLNIGNKDIQDIFLERSLNDVKLIYAQIAGILQSYRYYLNTSYKSMFFDYNPINNYDRTETHSYSESFTEGAQIETLTKGQKTDVSTDSGSSNTIQHGEQTQTSTDIPTSESISFGAQKITNNNGNQSNANSEKVFTFDGNEVNRTNTNITSNAYTDTSETQGYTNTTNYEQKKNTLNMATYNDSEIIGGKTVTNEYGESTDTSEKGQRVDTRTFNENINVSGNIGVMSTQQMIEQERQVANFNFSVIVCDILRKEVTKSEWGNDYGY